MKRPTWATVVGVLGILFGCSGIFTASQDIYMPKMLKMQKEMMIEMDKPTCNKKEQDPCANSSSQSATTPTSLPAQTINTIQTTSANKSNPGIPKAMQNMFDVPEWFEAWSIASGIVKALISAIYLFSAICILQLKKYSIRLFYVSAGASILLGVVKTIVAFSTSSFMAMAIAGGGAFGALIDVVLILVVVLNDKTAFYQKSGDA